MATCIDCNNLDSSNFCNEFKYTMKNITEESNCTRFKNKGNLFRKEDDNMRVNKKCCLNCTNAYTEECKYIQNVSEAVLFEGIPCENFNLKEEDIVNHPKHYTNHPSGVECIEITRHMNFNLGNAIKYIWRSDLKGHSLQDLQKAEFYIKDEIKRLEELKND